MASNHNYAAIEPTQRPLLLTKEQQKERHLHRERMLKEKEEQNSQFYTLVLRGLTPFVMVAFFTLFFGGLWRQR